MRPVVPMLASSLLLTLFLAPTGGAATIAIGIGEAHLPSCPPGSDKLLLVGTDNGDGNWTFIVSDRNTAPEGFPCAFVVNDVLTGPFTPNQGGCLRGQFTFYFCMDKVGKVGTMYEYDLETDIAGNMRGTVVISYEEIP